MLAKRIDESVQLFIDEIRSSTGSDVELTMARGRLVARLTLIEIEAIRPDAADDLRMAKWYIERELKNRG